MSNYKCQECDLDKGAMMYWTDLLGIDPPPAPTFLLSFTLGVKPYSSRSLIISIIQ